METIEARLAALAAMPPAFFVTTRYACGKVRQHGVRNASAAENHAFGERRKIGRELIDRDTGRTVKVVSVEVEPA